MLTKQAVKAAKAYEKSVPERDVARAKIMGEKVPAGPYLAIPLIGWLAQIGGGRFLSIGFSLLRISDQELVGTLGWAIPFGPRTEDACAAVLAGLGWDGRVWPTDPGWPSDSPHEGQIRAMLEEGDLGNALVFPPTDRGARAARVNVLSASRPFPLDPACVGPAEVPEGWKPRLWTLASNLAWFAR